MKFKSMVFRKDENNQSLVVEMLLDQRDNFHEILADLDAVLQKHRSKELSNSAERVAA